MGNQVFGLMLAMTAIGTEYHDQGCRFFTHIGLGEPDAVGRFDDVYRGQGRELQVQIGSI